MIKRPYFCIFTTLILLAGCGSLSGDEDNEAQQAIDEESKALRAIAEDPEYRQAVASFGEQAPNEEEAFTQALESDTHSRYIAFLTNYPSTKHRAAIDEKLTQFRLFSTDVEKFVSTDELDQMCWPVAGRMGYWRATSGLAGMMMTGGESTTFGPMMYHSPNGSIQIISGGHSRADGGYSFAAGTKLIYSTICHSDQNDAELAN